MAKNGVSGNGHANGGGGKVLTDEQKKQLKGWMDKYDKAREEIRTADEVKEAKTKAASDIAEKIYSLGCTEFHFRGTKMTVIKRPVTRATDKLDENGKQLTDEKGKILRETVKNVFFVRGGSLKEIPDIG